MVEPGAQILCGVDSSMERTEVAIIGAGFSGLCMAIQLQRAGRGDFVVFEAGELSCVSVTAAASAVCALYNPLFLFLHMPPPS
jgi:glycine/D-amino acid oxidase-like deaminating enzyme